MADDNGSPAQTLGNSNNAIRRSRASTSRSGHSYGSYETGESSTAASALQGSFSTGGSTLGASFQPDYHDDAEGFTRRSRLADDDNIDDTRRKRRSHMSRTTGGFLLSDPVFDEKSPRSNGKVRDDGRRRSRLPVDNRKAKSPMSTTPDKSSSKTTTVPGLDDTSRSTSERLPSRNGRPPSTSRIPSPRPSTAMDVDSTQIVNMALNLSESRRLAQRRNVSSPIPPRLAQLPDSPAGGSLKQHLQQQRRTSRNISPKPDKGSLAPRNVSSAQQRISSPLQASFDPDTSYTYRFSSSTLNRAQKAKEHLELMAQHRRLLQLVPPLQYTAQSNSRPSTSSPPVSPTADSAPTNPSTGAQVPLNRPYNPLQYIRNRKVRARERKAVDGEAQGFADVDKVTEWVNQAATLAATSPLQPEAPTIPLFPGAHTTLEQNSSSNIPVPTSNVSKPKRPRLDWVIEPADMLADLYWVEQDDHKYLIENRHYARIFPRKPGVAPRPVSQETNEVTIPPLVDPGARWEAEGSDASVPSESHAISRVDTEVSHSSKRDRARQKLHELRGIHHQHNSSTHSHHDFLHLRKSSFSDTSDSEVDRKKRERSGTVSANSKAILEKQMNDMLAKEASEKQKEALGDAGVEKDKPFLPTLMTPEKSPEPSTRGQSRKNSRVEDVEVFERINRGRLRRGSPVRSGRTSLEVPGWNGRMSMDLDTSSPPSPDLKAARTGNQYIPIIGMDLSPPGSRPVSPVRNPFSKVKSIFRDRSRERGERSTGQTHLERDERVDSPIEQLEQLQLYPAPTEGIGSPERRRSKSPTQHAIPRADTNKSHKSMGSMRLGREEQSSLRSLLKGPAKIDDFIRGGVSKVSDFIWKKDPEADGASSGTSSDESEVESHRGRLRTPAALSRANSLRPHERHQAKNYLDTMPLFKPAYRVDNSLSPDSDNLGVPNDRPSRAQSWRSTRFDQLKPPRIDVMNASPTSSPIAAPGPRAIRDAEASDTDLRTRDSVISTDDARKSSSQLNTILSLHPPSGRAHHSNSNSNRHWSISDRSPSPQRSARLSKRELARLKALTLSSGIKAMEIARRAQEPRLLFSSDNFGSNGIPWTEMSRFTAPDQSGLAVPQTELYSTTARILQASIETSGAALENSVHDFAQNSMHKLRGQVDHLHAHVASDLIDMTRRAADEADECSRDIVDSQRLKVKRVVDIIEKMMRRRRRRFRWARRGGWLMVEWVLVGFMWYVWFVVMIARIIFGVIGGFVGSVRWLLWL
ncbi:hypothetical protein BJ170DRAFT_596009 [Xylariales sp. AK1849]|nr:hypothetical protein BJ170DRAFT_596009 [Xylariales sp. AK1849]